MTIVHGGDDLPEEVPGLPLAEPAPLADVIVQLPFAGVLHDDHNLIFVLEHCRGNGNTQTACLPDQLTYDTETVRGDEGDVTGRGKQVRPSTPRGDEQASQAGGP